MTHTASESDATSLGGPSPVAAAAAYYVQSPSRDSHSSNSRSPSRSPSSYPRHSMSSASSTAACSRVSGGHRHRKAWNKRYCHVVPEGEEAADGAEGGCGADSSFLAVVLGLGVGFAGVCLVLWAASRPYKAQVSVESLRVENLLIGEGLDRTGVPTKLMSVNCSVNLAIFNPATFFGIYVTSQTANLIYSQITVATGQMKKHYLPRRSGMATWVALIGREVALYGARRADDWGGAGIPFKLEFEIRTRGYMVGKLVKTKQAVHVSCLLLVEPNSSEDTRVGLNSCKYI